jgi:hypothetical protein
MESKPVLPSQFNFNIISTESHASDSLKLWITTKKELPNQTKPVLLLPNEIEHYNQNLMHQFCLIYHFGNKTKIKQVSTDACIQWSLQE